MVNQKSQSDATGFPQLPQNFIPGARSLPQLGHLASPTGVPQFEQNFSDPTGLPQLVQIVVRVEVSPVKCCSRRHLLAHLVDLLRGALGLHLGRQLGRIVDAEAALLVPALVVDPEWSRGHCLKLGMISSAAFFSAASRAPRSVTFWIVSAALRAPHSPPRTLLAPSSNELAVPSVDRSNSLR